MVVQQFGSKDVGVSHINRGHPERIQVDRCCSVGVRRLRLAVLVALENRIVLLKSGESRLFVRAGCNEVWNKFFFSTKLEDDEGIRVEKTSCIICSGWVCGF